VKVTCSVQVFLNVFAATCGSEGGRGAMFAKHQKPVRSQRVGLCLQSLLSNVLLSSGRLSPVSFHYHFAV